MHRSVGGIGELRGIDITESLKALFYHVRLVDDNNEIKSQKLGQSDGFA